MQLWYTANAPTFIEKKSKSILHPFTFNGYRGYTLNVYQGCQHRCGYCYATYLWSPDFYDKIYAKSNAAQILESELDKWKSGNIDPVMVSSASDPYQPAERKYQLTRQCLQVLQKFNVPYYIFTKSTLISRDIEIHKKYRENCFVVWSITTSEEKIRRIVEPGTPPAAIMFKVIKQFCDCGIRCAVNIDPIIPYISDNEWDIEKILDECQKAGVKHVFGAFLRLRKDIWERMKMIIKLLNQEKVAHEYNTIIREYKKLYNFHEPLNNNYNLSIDPLYSNKILNSLNEKVVNKGMSFNFPHLTSKNLVKSFKKNKYIDEKQLSITNFI